MTLGMKTGNTLHPLCLKCGWKGASYPVTSLAFHKEFAAHRCNDKEKAAILEATMKTADSIRAMESEACHAIRFQKKVGRLPKGISTSAAMLAEHVLKQPHEKDGDCLVDPDTGCCIVCSVERTEEPCRLCGRRSFHVDGCFETLSCGRRVCEHCGTFIEPAPDIPRYTTTHGGKCAGCEVTR